MLRSNLLLRFAPLALLLPLGAACTSSDHDAADETPDNIDQVLLDNPCAGEPAQVLTASVDQDDLIVDVTYGGCHEAAVWACWDGQKIETFPGSVEIEIHHGDAGDCDAAFQTTASFDLTPVIERMGRDDRFVVNAGEQTTEWSPPAE